MTYYCPKCGKELKRSINLQFGCITPGCSYILCSERTIDISYKSQGIAKALSNLCNYPFETQGLKCQSMESFIQSLRTKDTLLQRELCSQQGIFCYNIRTMLPDWRETQTVYLKGKQINRHSPQYREVLTRAYQDLFAYSFIFREAIFLSRGFTLAHTIGCTDANQTLLTPNEYLDILSKLKYCENR